MIASSIGAIALLANLPRPTAGRSVYLQVKSPRACLMELIGGPGNRVRNWRRSRAGILWYDLVASMSTVIPEMSYGAGGRIEPRADGHPTA